MRDLPHVMSINFNEPDPPRQAPTQAQQGSQSTSSARQNQGNRSEPVERDSRSPSPSGEPSAPFVRETTPHLRQMLGLGPDDEISLNALVDPPAGEKPNYPYPTLIKLAIHGSPNKRLTLQEIYIALEERFEWYKINSQDKSWQVSLVTILAGIRPLKLTPLRHLPRTRFDITYR